MKKILVIGIAVAILLGIGGAFYYNKVLAPKQFYVSQLPTHVGAGTLREGTGEVPENLYTDTGIIRTDEYEPFTKKMTVYGITFVAKDTTSDEFLLAVADTLKDMFRVEEGTNTELQEQIITSMYKYKALIPVLTTSNEVKITNPGMQEVCRNNSVCDIIMSKTGSPNREVVEHLLHSITNVGLHYAMNDEWGLGEKSQAYQSMMTAIENKQYDTADYAQMKSIEEIWNRVVMQEYTYWIITAKWGLQESRDELNEWTLNFEKELKEQHQIGYELVETLNDVMYRPDDKHIEILKSFSTKKNK